MTPSSPSDLTRLIVDMDQRGSLDAIRERLAAGDDPGRLMDECRVGMERVGEMYERGEYFVTALIMAGEIFRQAAGILLPRMTESATPQSAHKVVIATVRGDIHDIGKNIVVTLLEARGFSVVDLGVDVGPEAVAEAVAAERPDVLGLSCLLTTGFEALRETIALVREQSLAGDQRVPVVIGGTAIDQRTADHTGADGWCADAAAGMAVIAGLLR
jgi:methylmalonyl-CoA mutase cobalamin-binding domain/chain